MADAAAKRKRRRRRTCIGGGGSISALPEHVLHGIFSRVGNFKDLFMFAVTCRRWLRRFTDPAFLRDLQAEGGHRARLLGVFLQHRTSPTFLPAGPWSPLSARSLSSFVSDSDDGGGGDFNYAEPLAARRGILLLQLAPRRTSSTCHLFALCNPITGERHLLPPLEWSRSSLGGGSDVRTFAIITSADTTASPSSSNLSSSSSSSLLSGSQLLVTTSRAHISHALLHSYSAATRSWSKPTVFFDGWFRLVGERSAVVHQGAAHWLCIIDGKSNRASVCDDHSLHKLSVDLAATSRVVSLTKLPIRGGGRPLLCVSGEDKLVVASVYPLHVTVWTQQQGEVWDPTPTTAFRIPAAVPAYYPDEQEEWFNFNRGSMLVMYRSSGVFILDIDKKVMDKVMDCCFHGKPNLTTCVAYEMDLVEFFTLQLGVTTLATPGLMPSPDTKHAEADPGSFRPRRQPKPNKLVTGPEWSV